MSLGDVPPIATCTLMVSVATKSANADCNTGSVTVGSAPTKVSVVVAMGLPVFPFFTIEMVNVGPPLVTVRENVNEFNTNFFWVSPLAKVYVLRLQLPLLKLMPSSLSSKFTLE